MTHSGTPAFRSFLILAVLLGMTCLDSDLRSARADLPQARLLALFPPGGTAGTTLDLSITSGQDLEEAGALVFDHPGIVATAKRQDVAGQSELVTNAFSVTIAPDVPPGYYEVRAKGLYGLSNPRLFVVSNSAELLEIEPNNQRKQPQTLPLDTTLSGKANGGSDLDWFTIQATAGQRLIVECLARRIDSRFDPALELYDTSGRRLAAARAGSQRDTLLDVTVPADGVCLLKLYDFVFAGGEEYTYRLRATTGPYVDAIFPSAITPGTSAEVTVIGRNLPGAQTGSLREKGRPLDELRTTITAPVLADRSRFPWPLRATTVAENGFSFRLPTANGLANAVPVFFATEPVAVETEPNNQPTQAQSLTLPVDLSGRFQQQRDVDLYQFQAKGGDTWSIEVRGQQLGLSTDPHLSIDLVTANAEGVETLQRISAADDGPAGPLPFLFDGPADDPVLRFTAPSDGLYRLTVRDRYAASRGDASLTYRLVVRRPVPLFDVVAVPSTLNQPNQVVPNPWSAAVRRGEHLLVHVGVQRYDGFDGPVRITAEGLPPGMSCQEITLGTTPPAGVLVFTASADAPAFSGPIRITGTALLPAGAGGASEPVSTTRDARIGTVLWAGQANQPGESRRSESLSVSILEEAAPFQVSTPVQMADLRHGSQLLIPVAVERRSGFAAPVNLSFFGVPPNLQVENKAVPADKQTDLLRCGIPNNVPAGIYVMYLTGQANVSYRRNVPKYDLRKAQFDAAVALLDSTMNEKNTATAMQQTAQTQLAEANTAVTNATTALQQAEQGVVTAREQVTVAEQAVATAGENPEAQAAAAAQLTSAQATVSSMTTIRDQAMTALATLQATQQTAAAAVTAADAQLATIEQTLKQATDAKAAAEQRFKDQENASKPQDIGYQPPSTPIVVTIKPAPVALTVKPANEGKATVGTTLQVTVDIARVNNFTGSVTLQLAPSPGAVGFSAEPVTIAADQTTGTLTIAVAGDAPEQTLPFTAIRALADFEGSAIVDQNFSLVIVK